MLAVIAGFRGRAICQRPLRFSCVRHARVIAQLTSSAIGFCGATRGGPSYFTASYERAVAWHVSVTVPRRISTPAERDGRGEKRISAGNTIVIIAVSVFDDQSTVCEFSSLAPVAFLCCLRLASFTTSLLRRFDRSVSRLPVRCDWECIAALRAHCRHTAHAHPICLVGRH